MDDQSKDILIELYREYISKCEYVEDLNYYGWLRDYQHMLETKKYIQDREARLPVILSEIERIT